jgi:hypothetical protein
MIPVDQTSFGKPEGNCLQAALAFLLKLPLDEVPHVVPHDDWWDRLTAWALRRGFELVPLAAAWTPRGYYLAAGPAARSLEHVCAYRDGALAHDPHPDRSGLLEVSDQLIVVPLDPARVVAATTAANPTGRSDA